MRKIVDAVYNSIFIVAVDVDVVIVIIIIPLSQLLFRYFLFPLDVM